MQIQETRSRVVSTQTAEQKAKTAEKIKKLQKDGEKLIRGMFEFIDAQGGWFDFCYRFYPGEPIRTVKINHGEIVEIPMDLAKHLNGIRKKIRTMRQNADSGKDIVEIISITRFTPIDMLPQEMAA